MAKGIRFYETGGPEVMQWESLEVGAPGPGEVRVRHAAVGLNFADTYFRSGLYPAPLPAGMGVEASGVVEAVGTGVTDFAEGDRVTYTGSPLGAYSTERVMSADHLIKLPDTIPFETAAAMTMRGLTSSYLLAADRAGAEVRRHRAAARRRRRGRPHLHAVGQPAGCQGDRHRLHRREGRRGSCTRLRAHHRLQARGRRDPGARAHRRQGCAGGLRQHRADHVPELDRLARAPRPARVLRHGLRSGPADQRHGARR